MFTGLVAGKGMVARSSCRRRRGSRCETPLAAELAAGDSIAVNGVCLTAVEPDGGSFAADVMAETLRRTSLGPLGEGDEVNLELPLRAGDRLGGHIVQGHVDGTGTVECVREDGVSRVVRVSAPAELLRYVVEKGSIARGRRVPYRFRCGRRGVRGVADPRDARAHDARSSAAPGRPVNLEVDVLAKYVEKLRRPGRGRA